MKRKHVSVYRVHRCYGGPEEGGWWYDAYELVCTRNVRPSQVNHCAGKLYKIYDRQDLNSMLKPFTHIILVEKKVGQYVTRERPTYS